MTLNGLDIGGAETHVTELALELQRRGYQVLLASNGGSYVPQLEAMGMRHFQVPLNQRSFSKMRQSKKLLRKIIQEEQPDLVHAHARIPAFLCGQLQKELGFPFVTTAHWVFYTNFLLKRVTNWGQRTIAVSEDIKTYLMENYGVPAEHIFVTINGIDTDKFSPEIDRTAICQEFGLDTSSPILCSVSRLDDSRALAARKLIAIAPRLAETIPGIQLLIVGGGDVFDELNAAAQRANAAIGRTCITMTGPRTDINQLVAAGDIFVGVSRAALEAMSAAKPTILAGNEGYIGLFSPETLDAARENNFCCRGCPLPEEDRLYQDVVELLHRTPEERAQLGSYGRQVIFDEYSVSRMAEDCEKAYREVLPKSK
jgi:glycosyltransferase involved in cell wall biosynthesis